MNEKPTYELKLRAADQRKRLHDSVEELKVQVRDKLDVKKNIRQNIGVASGIVALIGLTVGYSFAGLFTRR
jgi:hypothetical protein